MDIGLPVVVFLVPLCYIICTGYQKQLITCVKYTKEGKRVPVLKSLEIGVWTDPTVTRAESKYTKTMGPS